MQLGPDRVIECPDCGTLATVFTLISGNTFGARWWTDGKMIAPMLPEPPAITVCKGCNRYYWLSDAKVVGEIPTLVLPSEEASVPDDWRSAEEARELSEAEYLEAIAAGMGRNREEELHLRMSAWWAGNDAMRLDSQDEGGGSLPFRVRSAAATANLEHLLEQLGTEDPDERLMKAELARELGRFEEAVKILDSTGAPSPATTDGYEKSEALIRRLAEDGDAIVREIRR